MWRVVVTDFEEGEAEYVSILHFESRYPNILHLETRNDSFDIPLKAEDHFTVFPLPVLRDPLKA
jgi:hypothetical protein